MVGSEKVQEWLEAIESVREKLKTRVGRGESEEVCAVHRNTVKHCPACDETFSQLQVPLSLSLSHTHTPTHVFTYTFATESIST